MSKIADYNEPIATLEAIPIQQRMLQTFISVLISVSSNENEFDQIFGKTRELLFYLLNKLKTKKGPEHYSYPDIINNITCSACVSLSGIIFVANNDARAIQCFNSPQIHRVFVSQKMGLLINVLAQLVQKASECSDYLAGDIALFYDQPHFHGDAAAISLLSKSEWYGKFISIWLSVCEVLDQVQK